LKQKFVKVCGSNDGFGLMYLRLWAHAAISKMAIGTLNSRVPWMSILGLEM
jgi:hypothetical protein